MMEFKKNLMSHHDFKKSIALYWIGDNSNKRKDPRNQSTSDDVCQIITRPSRSTNSSVISDLTPSSYRRSSSSPPTKKRKAIAITKSSLLPSGIHTIRLKSNVDRFPEPSTKSARCNLHWWAGE
mmetsp:Transcript_22657/g.25788  ORF Transcript_22657/g.25788 Transcript_22657/m.25788 type:complete len:124 (+) Transcript_22657:862-1233(+)